MKATIYHNPRCSKSREALALLREAGAEVEIVEYLKSPPTVETLHRLYARAGLSPREGLRRAELEAKALAEADEFAILEAMAINPILIERPLVETARGVVLARPPERVRDIL
ncbi:arsenate reductase (glutaredoxin) [Sphingomonas carotinifaciens]|uniref:Arsenate reductase n=1 Tax=Sphingomonas carotinifaciens TaxID=1166323 RepID=A0A1G7I2I2_9SPHN|nr:arsenate reductase (glutaredoxin) [Sphingomonas carotinifaciens]MBB4085029.1 arsenate reductase [Sphingomonas carotinifaciens]MWC44410.1 arsenate reductase (glutaredoxin) [Sphingomonas carotinifaciens]SDF06773.1 arsenate reductase [Sphingomonas carotinifaciens]